MSEPDVLTAIRANVAFFDARLADGCSDGASCVFFEPQQLRELLAWIDDPAPVPPLAVLFSGVR